MPFITLGKAKEHLNFSNDMGGVDDDLVDAKILAVEAYLDSALGYRMADRYGADDLPSYPADIVQAGLLLLAHWYENREAAGAGAKVLPFGASEIIQAHREWTF